MKIFLIGMPGSGKTTIGKKLSEILKLPFIDLDQEIVNQKGRSIPEIFQSDGESRFREMESFMLQTLALSRDAFVMSTGGGTPCFHNSMDFIKKNGVSVYLKTSVETLSARVKENSNRPLLYQQNPEEKLKQLLEARASVYEQADWIIENASAEKLAEVLLARK